TDLPRLQRRLDAAEVRAAVTVFVTAVALIGTKSANAAKPQTMCGSVRAAARQRQAGNDERRTPGASHGFPCPVRAMPQAWPGFRRRDAEDADADGVVLIAAVEHDERAFERRLIHVRGERVPMEAVDLVEQAVQLHQVELKIDVQHLAVAAAADEFRRAEI